MESWFGLYGNLLIIALCVNLIATGLVQSIPLYITLPPKIPGFHWMFPKIGVLQNGWFIMKTPIKMDDLGGFPIFLVQHPLFFPNAPLDLLQHSTKPNETTKRRNETLALALKANIPKFKAIARVAVGPAPAIKPAASDRGGFLHDGGNW